VTQLIVALLLALSAFPFTPPVQAGDTPDHFSIVVSKTANDPSVQGSLANPVVGIAFSITVQVLDASNNPATTSSVQHIALDRFAGSGNLAAVSPTSLTAAIAISNNPTQVFNKLTYDKAESVTIRVQDTNTTPVLPDATVTFTVDPAPTKLVFTSNVANVVVGQTFDVTVQAQDNNGTPANLIASTDITLASIPGVQRPAGSTLGGTLTRTMGFQTNSVTFTGISADTAGAYILTASGGSFVTINTNTFAVGQASTTTMVSSSANPSVFGQRVTFTATVNVTAPGAGTPTGTVNFFDGATLLGTGTLSGGVAAFSTSNLAVGNHTITATYSGDSNFIASTSNTLTQTVNKASTTTTVSASANPSAFGQNVTFTATVAVVAPGAGTPTGTVSFLDGLISIGNVALNPSGQASLSKSDLTAGTHSIGVSYGGDGNFILSTGTTTVTVNAAAPTVTGISPNSGPITGGTIITITGTGFTGATAAAFGGTPATSFTVNSDTSISAIAPASAAGTVDVRVTAPSGTSATSAADQYTYIVVATPPTLAAAVGASSIPVGGTTSLTFTVSNPNAALALTGVAFNLGLPSGLLVATPNGLTGTCLVAAGGVTPGNSQAVNVAGQGLMSLTNLGLAANTSCRIAANVLGTSLGVKDFTTSQIGSNETSTGNPASGSITLVAPQPAALSAAFNPTSVILGDTSLLTITVTNPNGGALSNVAFSNVVPANLTLITQTGGTCSTLAGTGGGTINLNPGAGSFSSTSNSLAAGASCNVTLQVRGSQIGVATDTTSTVTSTEASEGTAASATLTVTTATTTTVTSSANPSVFGQAVTFTATVAPTIGGGTPTGTVGFFDGGVPVPGFPAQTLVNGQASIIVASLSVGNHVLTASYSGDTNFATSTSPILTQVVDQSSTTTSLTSSGSPTVFGQAVTLTATVTVNAPSAGTPTGAVQFFDGTTLLGSGTLNNGQATLTTSSLTVGSHSITAVYNGDTNFIGSTNASVSQTVSQASATTALAASAASPTVFGQPVTFTATVTANAPSGGIPGGTVTFADGANTRITLGTSNLDATGKATFTTNTLSVGNHSLVAVYDSNANFAISESAALPYTVNQASTITEVTSSPNPSVAGQSATFTATVTANAPSTATPTGTVSVDFGDGTTSAPTNLVNGSATVSHAFTGPGTFNVTATYAGTTSFAASVSTVTQTVNQAATTTTVTSSLNPAQTGQSITFTATVAPIPPGSGTPTGTVIFTVAGVAQTPVALSGGIASITRSFTLVSNVTITAAYSGDANFTASDSTGSPLTESVSSGPPARLMFGQQPTNSTGGAPINPAITVRVEDAFGNLTTTASSAVTLAIATNPGGGTLSGTLTVAAVNGVATFANLSINRAAVGYTLTVAAVGLTSTTSAAFTVGVGPAVQLAFTVQPGGGTQGTVWATQPVVAVQDAGGNTVPGATDSITLNIATGTGGAVLTCAATTKTAVAGLATFAGCTINLAGSGYQLAASAAGLTSATSADFLVSIPRSGGDGGGPVTPPPPDDPIYCGFIDAKGHGSITLRNGPAWFVVPYEAILTQDLVTCQLKLGPSLAGLPSPGEIVGTTFEVVFIRRNGQLTTQFIPPTTVGYDPAPDDLALAGGVVSRLKLLRYDDAEGHWTDLDAFEKPLGFAGLVSRVSKFAVVVPQLAPVLTGPPNGTVTVGMDPVLTWSAPAGTQQYQLQVAPMNGDGPAINLMVGDPALVAAQHYAIQPPDPAHGNYLLLPDMGYTWRVRTTSLSTPLGETDRGWSDWSIPRTFRTAPPTSVTLHAVSPLDGGRATSLTPTVVWSNANPSIFYYEVQLSSDPSFVTDPELATAAVYWNLIHGGLTDPPNSWMVPESARLLSGATYYWRVRPRVQGDGVPVDWSDTWRFTTP
jgi:hypothetical protein